MGRKLKKPEGLCLRTLSKDMEDNCTLAISSNTRLTGLAIMKGTSLLDYQVRLNKEKWSDTKAQKIIASLQSWFSYFNIQNIILSIPHEYYQTQEMVYLHQKIIDALRGRNVPVTAYPIREVFSFFKLTEKEKKKPFQKTLSKQFPELYQYHLRACSIKTRYYDKLFEAVGTLVLHHRKYR
jgi:hypothetical protein